jgi:putative aldouronate transport system permease protein
MSVGRIFNSDFGLFYSLPMDSGPLYPATQVIDTYVYRALEKMHDVGMSTAAGLLQNVVGFICIMTTNVIVKKVDPESALF